MLPVDENALAALRAQISGPVWLAASTHPGEEQIVRTAHDILLKTFPDLVTVIAPRHPERGAEIAALAEAPRRGLGEAPAAGKIYVADTMGELGLFYRAAPFAFVGGSLVPHGGQNIIEPARLGRAVISGPHTENFADAGGILKAAGALVTVDGAAALADAAAVWLGDPAAAEQAGQAAAGAFAVDENLPARLATLILETAL
jgi:3-deoxy-D-manno-octulosonic-acid transferase